MKPLNYALRNPIVWRVCVFFAVYVMLSTGWHGWSTNGAGAFFADFVHDLALGRLHCRDITPAAVPSGKWRPYTARAVATRRKTG